MVGVWDPEDEITRIKCDSPWHSLRDPDPLESLLVGGGEMTKFPVRQYGQSYVREDDDDVSGPE